MRRRTKFLFLLPLSGLFFAPNGALGQNYGGGGGYPYAYDGGRGDSDYYGEPDPYYGDFDRPTRARPRRGLADDRDPYDIDAPDREPGPNSRAARRQARLAALPPDADPAYSTDRKSVV